MTAKQKHLGPILDRMEADGLFQLILASGHQPYVYVDGSMQPVSRAELIDLPTLHEILHDVAGPEVWAVYRRSVESRDGRAGVSFALRHNELRIRVHVTGAQGRVCAVFRRIDGLPEHIDLTKLTITLSQPATTES